MEITTFNTSDGWLRFKQPLLIQPIQQGGWLMYERPDLSIYVWAESEEQAEAEIRGELWFLWDVYARALDETLTTDAQRLKHTLLAMVEGPA